MTKNEFIAKAKAVHGDKYDYSEVPEKLKEYSKITIRCIQHNYKFRVFVCKFLNRNTNGCPLCLNLIRIDNFIKKAQARYGDIYDYSLINNYKDKTYKIICPKHGVFEVYPRDFILKNAHGCTQCYQEKLREKNKQKFINDCKKLFGNKYDYSLVEYVNNRTYVKIICPIHGVFEASPDMILHLKVGCPFCGKNIQTTETWVTKMKQKYGDRYDYSLVEYKSSKDKVTIICKKHGAFQILPGNHERGDGGCRLCRDEKLRKTKEQFIKEAIEIHGDKYNYNEVVYKNQVTKVKIICPIHGPFMMTPNKHIFGNYHQPQGCPKCKSSHLHKSVERMLEENHIIYEHEFGFDWLKSNKHMKLDIFIPNMNIAIECHGRQHFKEIDFFGGVDGYLNIKLRDKLKLEQCKEHGITILYYSDYIIDDYELGHVYNDLNELLKEILKHKQS